MRPKNNQPDAPRYSQGLLTRSRRFKSCPQEDRISESAKAIRIETGTVLSSKSEMVHAPAHAV
jgi:hypothetical protein